MMGKTNESPARLKPVSIVAHASALSRHFQPIRSMIFEPSANEGRCPGLVTKTTSGQLTWWQSDQHTVVIVVSSSIPFDCVGMKEVFDNGCVMLVTGFVINMSGDCPSSHQPFRRCVYHNITTDQNMTILCRLTLTDHCDHCDHWDHWGLTPRDWVVVSSSDISFHNISWSLLLTSGNNLRASLSFLLIS